MRANILLIIIGIICIVGLLKPRIALYGYIWFGLMRPDVMAFIGHRFNLSTILALVTLVSSIRYFMNVRHLFKPIPILFILMQIVVAISVTNAVFTDYSWFEFNRFLRMSIMCLVIPVLITELQHFRELFLVTAASLGFLGFWWGLTAGIHGMRIYYGPGGFMSDNNSFSVALAMIVPFCWHARSVVKAFWAKAAYASMLMGSVVASILTYSRGGALAMGAALLLLILRSKHRVRSLALIVLAVIPVLGMVGASYMDRLSSIQTYQEDGSALSRIIQIKIAYQLWIAHPMLGVGIGDQNYIFASRPFLTDADAKVIVHNSFLQVLVHTGVFGFLIFTAMLVIALWICWRSGARLWKTDRDLAVYPIAIFASLVAYSVASMTHPRAWFDFFYMLLMYSSAWSGIAKQLAKAPVPNTPAPPRIVVTLPAKRQVQWQAPRVAMPLPRA